MNEDVTDTINLGLQIASLALMGLMIARVIYGPDAIRTIVMKGARGAESFCNTQAFFWARMADHASNTYDKARAVTV